MSSRELVIHSQDLLSRIRSYEPPNCDMGFRESSQQLTQSLIINAYTKMKSLENMAFHTARRLVTVLQLLLHSPCIGSDGQVNNSKIQQTQKSHTFQYSHPQRLMNLSIIEVAHSINLRLMWEIVEGEREYIVEN